jgi:hypothetical protein
MRSHFTCSVPNCASPFYGRSFCNRHYQRWRKHPDRDPSHESVPAERFWPKVEKTETCWLWTGALLDSGYGFFWVDNTRQVVAHRFAYELLVGTIPEGLQLDHLCRVRNCVNPKHLEPVTNRENALRSESFSGRSARQTHCVHGHPFDEANTYIWVGRPTHRQCRICMSYAGRRASRLAMSSATT